MWESRLVKLPGKLEGTCAHSYHAMPAPVPGTSLCPGDCAEMNQFNV